MTTPVAHTTNISVQRISSNDVPEISLTLTQPFSAVKSVPRLSFDFSVMAALFNPKSLEFPMLDFGSGTGWVSEFCVRMGFQVVAFDIHGDLQACLENRHFQIPESIAA